MNKESFTILELLVVISVLVILIGIAIPRFKGMQDAAMIAQVKRELQTLQTATESYYMNRNPNAYPGSAGAAISTTTEATYLVSAIPQIISSTPIYDPFVSGGTTEYRYQQDSGGKYYVWFSVGPNGTYAGCFVAGTEILLADGQKAFIENLKEGDILLGSQGEHNKVLKFKILPKMKRKIYAFNGGRFFVTQDHLFMTKKGWKSLNPKLSKHDNPQIEAGQLKVGDELINPAGAFVRLNTIRFKIVEDSVVYSPELDGNHTYYADGLLVHNPASPTQYISTAGVVTRSGDDICITNGSGC